jgi:hypothetical protein
MNFEQAYRPKVLGMAFNCKLLCLAASSLASGDDSEAQYRLTTALTLVWFNSRTTSSMRHRYEYSDCLELSQRQSFTAGI